MNRNGTMIRTHKFPENRWENNIDKRKDTEDESDLKIGHSSVCGLGNRRKKCEEEIYKREKFAIKNEYNSN